MERCQPAGVAEPVLCGTLTVPENRDLPGGRSIDLSIVVVPAKSENPPSDPVFVFEGGPGGAATGRAAGSVWAGAVRARDIVLVDQRGTGGSNPLHCDLGGGKGTRPGELREMFPAADVRACAAELAARAELARYTTEHHADDVEAVRIALGYGPINLRGGSYGTAAMMVYADRYPASTRSMFGIGSDSPLRSNLAERGVYAQRTLERLAGLCAAREACNALTPALDDLAVEMLGSLDAGPRRVEIDDPLAPGTRVALDVSREWLAEHLRLILYYAFSSRALPWALYRAVDADDWGPVVELALFMQRLFRSNLAYGVLLTVQCSEHMNFDLERARERGNATLFGNYRLEQQVQGCAAWPHTERSRFGDRELPVHDIPALFLSGALDPVTPPDYTEEAMTLFPNSRHIVLPEGQHGPFDLDNGWVCVHEIWADFLDHADPQAVDAGCAETMRRPPFIVDGQSFERYYADQLIPMID